MLRKDLCILQTIRILLPKRWHQYQTKMGTPDTESDRIQGTISVQLSKTAKRTNASSSGQKQSKNIDIECKIYLREINSS